MNCRSHAAPGYPCHVDDDQCHQDAVQLQVVTVQPGVQLVSNAGNVVGWRGREPRFRMDSSSSRFGIRQSQWPDGFEGDAPKHGGVFSAARNSVVECAPGTGMCRTDPPAMMNP